MAKKIKKNSSFSYNDRTVKTTQTSQQEIKQLEETIPDVTAENAPWSKRLISYIVDLILYLPITLLLDHTAKVMRASGDAQNQTQATYMTISIVCLAFILFGYLPKRWGGQTLGKKLVNIRIVPTNGKKIEFYKYLLREFIAKVTFGVVLVPITLIHAGYLKFVKQQKDFILLHDKLLDTRVVVASKVKKEKK